MVTLTTSPEESLTRQEVTVTCGKRNIMKANGENIRHAHRKNSPKLYDTVKTSSGRPRNQRQSPGGTGQSTI